MGYYINPKNMSKEQFLRENGEVFEGIPKEFSKTEDGKEYLMVCLVDNGFMTAAGICVHQGELEAFTHSFDPRPKTYHWVEKELLNEYL